MDRKPVNADLTPPSRPLTRGLAVVVAALALGWTALVNGQPFFHPDTVGYVRGPDVAVMKLLGPRFASPWTQLDPGGARSKAEAAHGVTPPAAKHGYDDKEVMGGRSIYYGVLADLGARTGGFWLTVFIQGLALAWLAEIVLRGLGVISLRAYAGIMALLVVATPAPFFVGFLMPDIWAGIGVGALAALFALPRRLTLFDMAALGAMTAFAALAHSSVAPVILAMMLVGLVLTLARQPGFRPGLGLGIGALALVVAAAGAFAFTAMVRHTVGAPPVNPPFLTARVIADGTGTRFAKAGCGGQDFVVCRYAARFPMDVDHFLWGTTERDGVFQTVSPAERRALGAEQVRFALAVAKAYPAEQAMASIRNAALQIVQTDLSDFNYKPSLQASFAATLPAQTLATMDRTKAHAQAWPLARFWGLQSAVLAGLVVLVGLIAVGGPRKVRLDPARDPHAGAGAFLVMVVAGVLANGAICGVLSTLYGRYEARVIWLVPLAALAWMMTRAQAASLARPALRVVKPS
ncbi:MAG: hypothetical protein P4L64_08950 [Caulobacteraceae bacterium]|nr:hypothetical protein [Caulobacteraceae bacterium]